MKKLLAAICLLTLIVALCACTPDGGELREAYKGGGYDFQPFDVTLTGAQEYELADGFSVVKDANISPKVAYVLLFATLGEARGYVEDHAADEDKPNMARAGRLVVYGSEEAVAIAVA